MIELYFSLKMIMFLFGIAVTLIIFISAIISAITSHFVKKEREKGKENK